MDLLQRRRRISASNAEWESIGLPGNLWSRVWHALWYLWSRVWHFDTCCHMICEQPVWSYDESESPSRGCYETKLTELTLYLDTYIAMTLRWDMFGRDPGDIEYGTAQRWWLLVLLIGATENDSDLWQLWRHLQSNVISDCWVMYRRIPWKRLQYMNDSRRQRKTTKGWKAQGSLE